MFFCFYKPRGNSLVTSSITNSHATFKVSFNLFLPCLNVTIVVLMDLIAGHVSVYLHHNFITCLVALHLVKRPSIGLLRFALSLKAVHLLNKQLFPLATFLKCLIIKEKYAKFFIN